MDGPVQRSAAWLYAGQILTTVLGFVAGVVLARLLGPPEFGLFIAVTAFTSVFMMIVQFGLPQALLQARTLSAATIDGAFWWMVLCSWLMVAAALALAPLLAGLYDSEGFALVLGLMSAMFLIAPYNGIGLALLRRELRFDLVVRIEVLALLVSMPVGIGAALAGAGVFALVGGALVGMLVVTVALARTLTWRPGRPRLASGLLGYGWFAMLNALLGTTAGRVDNMLVGGLLGTAALGLYNRAFSLARIPTDQFADSLGPLVLRTLAVVQDDPARGRALVTKATAAIALVTLPLLALLLVGGPLAIGFLYGPAWAGAGEPLRIMVVGALFLVLSVGVRGYINALGLVRALLWVNALGMFGTVAMILALWPFGLNGVAIGISLREAAMFLLLVRLLARAGVGVDLRGLFLALAPALLASAVASLAGWWVLGDGNPWPAAGDGGALLLIGVVMTGVYGLVLGLLMWLWRGHAGLAWARELLYGLWQRRRRGGAA